MSQGADKIIKTWLRGADSLVQMGDPEGRKAARELLSVLEEADERLSARLRRIAKRTGGLKSTFSEAQAQMYRAQIAIVVEYVKSRLAGLTDQQATRAIQKSIRDSSILLEKLEKQFTGISAPLRLRQAAAMNSLTQGVRATLLRQHLTSVDRYGEVMIAQFERIMRVGLIGGESQDQMIGALTGHGGPSGKVSMKARVTPSGVLRLSEENIPEGLFKRYKYWAARIVRTETAKAYNSSRLQGLFAERSAEMPDMQKKILAVMDNRTAPDSIAVHGQIRELDEFFTDGAGRRYLSPPARPNDREVVIPWRPHWPETPTSRPMPSYDREEAERLAMPIGSGQREGVLHKAARRRRLVAEAIEERKRRAQSRRVARQQF